MDIPSFETRERAAATASPRYVAGVADLFGITSGLRREVAAPGDGGGRGDEHAGDADAAPVSRPAGEPTEAAATLDPPVEARLLARARTGDRGALGELLELYYPRLWGVCRRVVGDPAVSDDLVQDAMVKIIAGLPGFAGDAKFSTWAIRVTMNVCLSHLRKAKVRRTAGPAPPAVRPMAAAAEPPADADPAAGVGPPQPPSAGPVVGSVGPVELPAADRVEQNEALARVEVALARLDAGRRTVLVLRDMHGLEYAEIAASLGVAVGTVKSRLSRAREALRAELERDQHADTPDNPRP